jgi:hypothetical protein
VDKPKLYFLQVTRHDFQQFCDTHKLAVSGSAEYFRVQTAMLEFLFDTKFLKTLLSSSMYKVIFLSISIVHALQNGCLLLSEAKQSSQQSLPFSLLVFSQTKCLCGLFDFSCRGCHPHSFSRHHPM